MINNIRELAVFLQIFNGTFRAFALLVEILLISVVVVNASMAVNYLTFRECMVTAAGIAMCTAFFRTISGVYENARNIYAVLRPMTPNPYFSRHEKAYRALRVEVGRFGFADMYLCLTVLSTILGNTAYLALTTE